MGRGILDWVKKYIIPVIPSVNAIGTLKRRSAIKVRPA
jgi:hypothetical protein